MPSLRPQPSAAPRSDPKGKAPAKPVPAEPARSEDEEREAGGFHESSYELKTGVDILETEWPDDTTIPGALGDL